VVSVAQMTPFQTIDHDTARRLLEGGITVIDVRTPGEYAELGHLPGALLIPVDLIASAPAVLEQDIESILVYCEHGVRSRTASEVLAAAGIREVLNLAGGMAVWNGPREFGPGIVRGPASWLLENADLLPRGGRVLDVACGRGRHALLLAGAGFDVTAIDRDQEAVARLRAIADRLGFRIAADVIDLETDPPPDLGSQIYDAAVAFNYLHRPLFPVLQAAIKPGGRIFYETFTRPQAERGHPRNPAFLLEAGELPRLIEPFKVLRSREGDIEGRFIASVVAERIG
jgi:rhodanese-related sulfurtransferase